MPFPITRQNRLANASVANIQRHIRPTGHIWTPGEQQRAFNAAMAVLHAQDERLTAARAHLSRPANNTLRILARNYNRTWNNWPWSAYYMAINAGNSNSNNSMSWRSNSNSNSNSNRPNSNNSKVRKFAERWRLKGAVKLVNLPANRNNRTDPVSLHTFRAGQEAIRHQRRNAEGRVISTRYYLLPTIERLAGMKWNAIRRIHPNKVLVKGSGPGNKFLATKHVPNVITRLPMYRRNLTLVKFK
jgi:hypothetical protein